MGGVVPATEENIEHAAELLRRGELVCFPTETVYGLGADASNPRAVRGVFAAKGRPADHPLIVHLPDAGALEEWADRVPVQAKELAAAFWPGPMTIVLRRGERVPLEVTGGQDTVALRVPGHPVALRLLDRFGGGVAAPSANRFGRISPTSADHAADEIGVKAALILDGGPAEVGVESTIVDLSRGVPRILRPGIIGRSALEAVLGAGGWAGGRAAAVPRVPGALESHYSPESPVMLVSCEGIESGSRLPDSSVLSTRPRPDGFSGHWLRMPADPRGYARRLYAALRELDELGRPILVEEPPPDEEWEAVRDRLSRASAGRKPVAEEEAT